METRLNCLKCGMGYAGGEGNRQSGERCKDRSSGIAGGCTGRLINFHVYRQLLRELGVQYPDSQQIMISVLAFGDTTTMKYGVALQPKYREMQRRRELAAQQKGQ